MLFRIVRINGDGTIRIVTDEPIGTSMFNKQYDSEEYAGYTYKTRIGYEIGNKDEEKERIVTADTIYYFADEVKINRVGGNYTLINPVSHTISECYENKSLCEGKYTHFESNITPSNHGFYMYKVTKIESDTSIKYQAYQFHGKTILDPNSKSTDSTIKQYLDAWYTTNIAKYDSLFANTRYCNDTTSIFSGLGYLNYGAENRIRNKFHPTYICPETDKTYGGEYILKVGLLSGDEAAFAGGLYFCAETDFYLSGTSEIKILMSPVDYIRSINYTFGINEKGRLYAIAMGSYNDVVPVLNLRKDITFTKGVGTKEDPYTIIVE